VQSILRQFEILNRVTFGLPAMISRSFVAAWFIALDVSVFVREPQ